MCLILFFVIFINLSVSSQTNGVQWHNADSDIYLNSIELIEKVGYKGEEHVVKTEDGYLLNIFRIPGSGPPVVLMHGIGDSSDSWLVLGPQRSLAYLLADAGFDVWLMNARGNKYSKRHTENISYEKYWRFTFEDIGSKDTPSTIDYILAETGWTRLTYIGFSQGTTVFLVMGALRPEYNEKISEAILLAPVAWVKYMKHPIIKVVADNYKKLQFLAESFGIYEVFASNPIKTEYHAMICHEFISSQMLCDLELFLYYGLNSTRVPADCLTSVSTHIPAGASSFSFLHFIQNYLSRKFQRYDYGILENRRVYGTAKPPVYDVSNITIPVSIFGSTSDWYSDVRDIKRLKQTLPNVHDFTLINDTFQFTHLEYVYGSLGKSLVYDKIIQMLIDHNKNYLLY